MARVRAAGIRPQLVLLETSTPSINMDLELARMVKGLYGATVVLAGTHASALPEELLAHDFIDYVRTIPGLGFQLTTAAPFSSHRRT